MSADSVTVLGAGSWGTALAILLARNGQPAVLWGHDPVALDVMREEGVNARYLPGVAFPTALRIEPELARAVAASQTLLLVVPSHAFRSVLAQAAPHLRPKTGLAWATKGLEPGSDHLLHQVVEEVLGPTLRTAVVSGPTFALEVARGLPTAVTVASRTASFASALAARLHDTRFRAYTSDDIVGVQLGGAVKNVLAIAAGIADGLGFGSNTRAALITRGLAEMMRLGVALGGRRETFMGLAGLGDLVLTCTDDQSRNRRLGLGLGRGKSVQAARAAIDQVVEGMQTATEVRRLAAEHGVEMPISDQVYRVLQEEQNPVDAVRELLDRDQKAENA